MMNLSVSCGMLMFRPARCLKVVDGDTFDLMVDLGFDVYRVIRVRLKGIDTWEVRGSERPKGLVAKARVEELMENKIQIISYKGGQRGSFRRWLVDVQYLEDNSWKDLATTLKAEGHGV